MSEGVIVTASGPGGSGPQRLAIRTHWIEPGEDIGVVAERYAERYRQPGDVLLVSEKVVAVSLGHAIPAGELAPGRLARLLVAAIGKTQQPGLSIPERMEYVVRRTGRTRVVLAALLAGVARPFGASGVFQRVVGEWCRDIDGMIAPYEHAVIPPLDGDVAAAIAASLAERLRMPVAILDLHDRGGEIRAVAGGVARDALYEGLSGNPLGQRDRGTPLGLLRLGGEALAG